MAEGKLPLSRADYEAARARIGEVIRCTPCDHSASLSEGAGVPVWLKLEHHQHTGAFKLRGAANAVAQLTDAAGVTTASTGNHGRALAYAAKRMGLRAVICMSRLVLENKLAAIRALGAEARVIGASQDEAHEEATRLVEQEGLAMVPPFDDLRVIAGQGTLGLEMIEDVPEVDTVLIPLSGGGLLAGVAGAMKALRPSLRVIGISMERGAAMAASLEAGRPVPVEELPTLADSLGGGVGLYNRYTLAMVRELVDDVVLLSEAEIAEGIRHCYWQERQIVEGAAAVGVAAILAGKVGLRGPTCVLLSGGNIDMRLHARIIAGDNPDLMQEA
ncbi:MAG: hydroxyectoine utilization dehydratase EutB [Hyphomicrobiales bacterium]